MPKRREIWSSQKKLKELLLQKGSKRTLILPRPSAKPQRTHGVGCMEGSRSTGMTWSYCLLSLGIAGLHCPWKTGPPEGIPLDIAMSDKDKELIERTEGKLFVEKLSPFPLPRPISAGSQEMSERIRTGSLSSTGTGPRQREFHGYTGQGRQHEADDRGRSLVGIDHSKRDQKTLDRKDLCAAPKRPGHDQAPDGYIGRPDPGDAGQSGLQVDTLVLRGEEINNAIVGKVAWCGKTRNRFLNLPLNWMTFVVISQITRLRCLLPRLEILPFLSIFPDW